MGAQCEACCNGEWLPAEIVGAKGSVCNVRWARGKPRHELLLRHPPEPVEIALLDRVSEARALDDCLDATTQAGRGIAASVSVSVSLTLSITVSVPVPTSVTVSVSVLDV